jgi:hypothetical protein
MMGCYPTLGHPGPAADCGHADVDMDTNGGTEQRAAISTSTKPLKMTVTLGSEKGRRGNFNIQDER